MIRVVLVRPTGPRNVGAVLRAVTNFGPAEIVVTGPVRPSLLVHPDFEQMAHGVEAMAERIRLVESLDAALADVTHAVGFTARKRQHRHIEDWRDVSAALAARANEPDELVALVFGTEESGLSGEDASKLQQLVRMPTTGEHTSINLATTVAIALAAFFFERAPSAAVVPRAPLKGEARDYLRQHVREVLGDCALSDSIRDEIRASVDRVFRSADLETRDGRAWHAVMRALGNRKTPAEYGLDPSPQAGERRERALRRREGGPGDGGDA